MNKKVSAILIKFGVPKKSIDDLQSELTKAHCVIYKAELPPMNGQAIQHIDGTPDKNYPLRILQSYRRNCDCQWSETTSDNKPTNPLLKYMNNQCQERAKLLDRAIHILTKEIK